MPNGLEIIKAAIDDFKEIQEYMFLAREENAEKTYAKLKKKYLALKAILQIAGVRLKNQRFFNRQICADAQIRGLLAAWRISMTDIDEIKE